MYFLDAQNQWGTVAEIPGKQPGADPVTVQLAPCGSAVVRFVDARGKPVPNYHLNPYGFELLVRPVFPTDRKAPDQAALNLERVRLTDLDRLHCAGWIDDAPATDGQGRIRLPALIPGATYRVGISTSKRGQQKEFTVEASKTLGLPEFTIP